MRVARWPGLVLAAALVASACGDGGGSAEGVASASGSGSGNNKSSAKKKTDPQQAGLEFARCMREHGVDVPDPTPGEAGFAVRIGEPAPAGSAASGPASATRLEDDEAFQACKHILDDALGDASGPADPGAADRALKFAQCMREHGVNMPDPEVDGGRVRIMITGEGMDPNSPVLQEAHKACQHLFGPPGGAGGAGGPGVAFAPGRRS